MLSNIRLVEQANAADDVIKLKIHMFESSAADLNRFSVISFLE